MKFFLLLAILAMTFVYSTSAQIPAWSWARSGVGAAYDQASAVTTDMQGNVIVAGYFASDSIRFGTVVLQNSARGFDEAFLVKYSAEGTVVWARAIGGTGNDKASSVAIDAQGNVYLLGYYYSPTITIGSDTLRNAGAVGDIFLVKYDAQGDVVWTKSEGGVGLEIPYSCVVDARGNVIIAGRYSSNSIRFGSTTLLQAGSMDLFVVKYDAQGKLQWAKGAGGGSNDEAYAIAVDASDNVIVAGYFTQTATFGSIIVTPYGSGDVFIAKCDAATGNFLWVRKFGGSNDERAQAVVLDAQNNIYISGYFSSDSVAFGATTLVNRTSAGVENSFVAKLDPDARPLWAHALGSRSKSTGIALTPQGVYACGSFRADSLQYAGRTLVLQGSNDFYLLKSDYSGLAQWITRNTAGGNSNELATSMSADAWGNVVVAGFFDSDSTVFGPSVIRKSRGFDMFVARMNAVESALHSEPELDEWSIQPNPAHSMCHVRGPEFVRAYEIYNSMGQIVYRHQFTQALTAFELSVAGLSPGIYSVQIHGQNIHSRLLVVQR